MTDPIIPSQHWRIEKTIKAPYQVEQHQEEQVKHELSDPNVRWYHDPYWKERFFSIQHIHDCQTGKQFSWFWTPMTEIFNLSQVMFFILPFAIYANDRGANMNIRGVILIALSSQLLLSVAKYLLRWYHDWKFKRIPYKIIRH